MAQFATFTEIDRDENYVIYALPDLIYQHHKVTVEIEVWSDGDELTEITLQTTEGAMSKLREDGNFLARVKYHFFGQGLMLENLSLRESGAQDDDTMALTARLVTIDGLTKRSEADDHDMSPRFEAILNQRYGVTIWLHTNRTETFWELQLCELEEECWLEDGTAKLRDTLIDLDFATFDGAMKAVLAIASIESQTKHFEEI